MENEEFFDPGTRVDTGLAHLVFQHTKTGEKIEFPPLSCLLWKEERRHFIHCLELDLLADGADEDEALTRLQGVILEQMRSAQEDHTQLLHPAPKPYWEKFYQVRRNHLKQAFLDTAPTSEDIKVRDLALTHA